VARERQQWQLLISIPGVGVATASTFAAAVGNPDSFAKSRPMRRAVGLTTKRYQSGDVEYDGHILRCDAHLRGLL